jgi:hypothetical protein
MSLNRRLDDLEAHAGTGRPRPLIATVGLSHAPDPPRHFATEADLNAWFKERGRERPVVVVFEPVPDRSHDNPPEEDT